MYFWEKVLALAKDWPRLSKKYNDDLDFFSVKLVKALWQFNIVVTTCGVSGALQPIEEIAKGKLLSFLTGED